MYIYIYKESLFWTNYNKGHIEDRRVETLNPTAEETSGVEVTSRAKKTHQRLIYPSCSFFTLAEANLAKVHNGGGDKAGLPKQLPSHPCSLLTRQK